MKIIEIEPVIEKVDYITTDESIFGYYRRYESGIWEQLMGDSWEPCYSQEGQLEELYKNYKGK